MSTPLPFSSRKRTFGSAILMSALCQKRTKCNAAKRLFLECQPSELFQTRFERGEKASCFASSDGAMIKGER
jgi:hypothetical protein